MKKITILFTSVCALTCISNSFGMLPKTSRTIIHQKKIRSFHTSKSAHMDPIGTAAFVIAVFNGWDIATNKNSLENRIKQLENTMRENEKKHYNLALKIAEQNKKNNVKIKTDE